MLTCFRSRLMESAKVLDSSVAVKHLLASSPLNHRACHGQAGFGWDPSVDIDCAEEISHRRVSR